jgi:hypothetical protein
MLEQETQEWWDKRASYQLALRKGYTGVNIDDGPSDTGGEEESGLNGGPKNQQDSDWLAELKVDVFFSGARPDHYYDATMGAYGYPKTGDLETKIWQAATEGTSEDQTTNKTIPQQRQLDAMYAFRKAYGLRKQRRQQLFTNKQFMMGNQPVIDNNYNNLMQNVKIDIQPIASTGANP